jgi:hypothetical protein
MGEKNIPVTLMNKYEDMMKDLFSPITNALDVEKANFRIVERVKVLTEFGIADDVVRLNLLKAEMAELEKRLENFVGRYHDGGLVQAEVNRRMSENPSFKVFDDMYKAYIKYIRLASAPAEIKSIFENVEKEIPQLKKLIEKLPYSKLAKKVKQTEITD